MYKKTKYFFNKASILVLLFLFGSLAYAQTPGGVSGTTIEYWLRADQVSATLPADGADVTTWQDLSGNSRNFSNTEANPFFPKFNKSAMNFHSSVDFYFLDADDGGPSDANNRRRKLKATAPNSLVPDATKSYFAIWISKLDQEHSASEATVFGLNGDTSSGTGGNQYGWNGSNGRLWHRTRGTAYTHNSTTERTYGIGIAVLPNNSATAQQQYLNALASGTSMSGRTLGTGSYPSVIGTSATDTGSERYFFGEVMEIIVLSKDGAGQTLTADELKKINSHLAIKYGITLNAVQTDYLLSDGTVAYSSTASGYTSYNKDIFGIGRDDASGLYQKQSASTDNPVLTVYLGDFAETNAENTSTITDKHALMFGANGQTGNSSYLYPVGTAFQNYTLQTTTDPSTGEVTEEKLSFVFNYKLRAKTTGQSSFTVNVKPGMGQWLLVSSDEAFAPANTRIYKITNGEVDNVVINDGDYIGFASYLKAPGGVTNGLRMWLKADKNITLNGAGEVINWGDYSGFGTTFSKIVSNSTAPLYMQCDEKMNFHPSVYFRKSREYLSTLKGAFSVAAPDDYTFFSAINANFNTSSRIYFTSYGGTTRNIYPALGVREGADNTQGRARIYDGDGAGSVNGSAILFNGGATSALAHTMKKNTYFRLYADGYMEQLNESRAGRGSRLNGPGVLGSGGISDSRNIIGVMGEHIAYESDLSATERDKIDSYLGLKYAITTDKDKTSTSVNFDFKLSDGSYAWQGNALPASGYHRNVASVVRDDDADLNNKQAKSTDTGDGTTSGDKASTDVMHMGANATQLGCNSDAEGLAIDKAAVTWGHDVNKGVTTIANATCETIVQERLNRNWLVETTANLYSGTQKSQAMKIYMYYDADIFPYQNNADVYMLVDDNGDATNNIGTNGGWTNVVKGTWITDHYEFDYKFKNAHTFITFGAVPTQPTCTACEFDGQKKIEFRRGNGANQWANGDTTHTYDLTDIKVKVTASIVSPASFRSRYPRAYSQRTLREYRKGGDGTQVMQTKIQFLKPDGTTAISAKAKFNIYEISRRTRRLDKINVYGLCGGTIVKGKLSYVRSTRSSYTIDDQQHASGTRSSSYTSRRGQMMVEFDQGVEEIYIEHTFTMQRGSVGSGHSRIGIGPLTISCPKPLPPANEDGFIMTKAADSPVNTCDPVNFTYKVYNTATCDVKTVNFKDILPSAPSNMYWMGNSVSVSSSTNDTAIDTNNGAKIDEVEAGGSTYADAQTLKLDGLQVPAQGYITINATAYFEQNANGGDYHTGYSEITYTGGTNTSLTSCDANTSGCTETIVTATQVTQPAPIRVTDFYTDKSCYNSNGEITVYLKINNTGNAISDSNIDFTFEPADAQGTTDTNSFVYMKDYVSSSKGIKVTKTDGTLITSYDAATENAGDYEDANEGDVHPVEDGFTIPEGESIVSFKVKYNSLLATTGNPDLIISYDLEPADSGDCMPLVLTGVDNELTLVACTYCTKPGDVSVDGVKSGVGISTLKNPGNGNPDQWMSDVPNGHIVVQSKDKGFVITRTTFSSIADPVEGMLIYDTADKCIKMYDGTAWDCINERTCNE